MSTSSQQTTQIFVVDGGRACAPQPWMTISWQLTVCNATNYQFCPLGYVGVASRQCRCDRTWPWAEPDFSACVDRNVSDMQKLMKLVAMGYAVIDVSTIISKFSFYVQKKLSAWRMLSSSASSGSQSLLTGEGNGVIDLVTSISNYLWAKNHLFNAKFWNSSAVEFLRTLDLLLSMPPAYFSPQDDTPLLRIIQSHVTLLYKKVTEVMGELPPSNRFKLRNSNVLFGTLSSTGTQLATPRKFAAIQYDRIPPTLHIKGNFSWFEVASAPQFLFVKSGQRKNRSNSVDWTSKSDTSSINLTLEVSTSIQETQDSRYVCALLELERSGFDGMWDVNACGAAQRTQNVSFLCNCSAMGTVVLLHVHGFPQETTEPNWTWWIPIWISAWTGLLVSLLNLVLLSMKWYQKRTIWSWFQVQLAISLLPITFFYVSSPQNTENDVFWTLSLTTAIYHYLATILAMNLQLKLSFHAHCKSSNPKQRNSQFFIFSGVTSGITLGLSLVNVLLTSLSSSSFESWLKLGNHCVSSAFFYVASASLLLVITAFYLSSERKLNNFLRHKVTDTQQPYCDTSSRLIERVSYERCCVLLSAFSLLSIACVVGDHHWRSLPAHFLFTITNCLTVVVWTVTMLIFSQSRYRAYMGRSPAVSVVNQAAQSPHRPQTTDYFQPSDDEHSEMVAKVNLNVPLAVMKGSGKRSCRGAAAVSSPLLRHAGMGPDIRRAFSVDSADTLPEERSHPAPPAPQDTVGDKDGVEMGAQCHLLASHKTTAMDVGGDQWQREDLDSGLGPSGDGSQKLNGFDWFSDACRVFSRLRLSIPRRMRSGWNESMSSGTTELGVGDGTNSFTTAETEVPSPVADLTTTLPFPSHIRRSRTTRWMEDYGDGSQLVPEEAGDVVVCKPFRGFCLIRCSPERQPDGENEATSLVATKRLVTSARNCERCWHNPETPACELCCSADAADPQRHRSSGSSSSSFFIRAIVEKPPKTLSSIEGSSEYLTMDPAGSLAVGDYIKYQSYCNVQLKSNELQQIDVQSKFKFQSLSAPSSPKFNKCQRPSWRSIFRSTHSLASRRSSDDTT